LLHKYSLNLKQLNPRGSMMLEHFDRLR
jgi:hypothetical protein